MRIENELNMDTEELRRMVVWVCRQVGVSTKQLRRVTFRRVKTPRYIFTGQHRNRHITVRLGQSNAYPHRLKRCNRDMLLHDDWDVLVFVAAHEAAHVSDIVQDGRTNEHSADMQAVAVLLKWQRQRDGLPFGQLIQV